MMNHLGFAINLVPQLPCVLVFSRAHPSWAACCGTPLVPCHVPLDNDHSLLEMNGPSWQAGKLAGAAQIHHT